MGAPKLVLSVGNACIKCKQKTLNGTGALCGLGMLLGLRGRDPCVRVEGTCSDSCHAPPESGKLSWGIPENRYLRRSLYFLGRSAAVNPGGQLDGWDCSRLPFHRSQCDRPYHARMFIFFLEKVLQTLGGRTVLVRSLWL